MAPPDRRVAPRGAEPAGTDWSGLLERACAGAVTAAFQPIVDLGTASVVGYEALARFDGPPAGPEAWFRAARAAGRGGELEAAALRAGLRHRAELPPGCFLTVNLSPGAIGHPAVRAALDGEASLSGLVIEVTEDAPIPSYGAIAAHLDDYRAAGALVAVDDAGAGYAGLRHLLSLRPSFVKIDRHFVDGIDRDEAKRALVEMLGSFADRIDSWILAEGVERPAELDVLVGLGVPLAQGFLLGRPGPPWPALDATVDLSARPAHRARPNCLGEVLERCCTARDLGEAAAALAANPACDFVVLLDEHGVPVAAADPDGLMAGLTSEILRCSVDTPIVDAARRAICRPPSSRFQPLVCTDRAGRLLGVVRFERVVEHLARSAAEATEPARGAPADPEAAEWP